MTGLSPRLEHASLPVFPLSEQQLSVQQRIRRRLEQGDYPLEPVTCVCGEQESLPIAAGDRWGLPLRTVLCPRCGLMRSSPRMTEGATARFYREDFQDLFCADGERSLEERQAEALRQQLARGRRLVRELARLLPPVRTVYEVGCGTGGNLLAFAEAGKRVAGCDLGGDFLPAGRAAGLDLCEGTAGDLLAHRGGERGDLVLLLHVLEHFLDLGRDLSSVVELCRPGGLLLVEVPGIRCIPEGYGGDLQRYLQTPHNFHFTEATLRFVLERAGLEVLTANEAAFALAMRPADSISAPRAVAPPRGEGRAVLRYLAALEKRWHQDRARGTAPARIPSPGPAPAARRASRPVIQIRWMNGLANSLFQYAFARILAERHGLDLTYDRRPVAGQEHLLSPIDYGLLAEGREIAHLEPPPGLELQNLFHLAGRSRSGLILSPENQPVYGDYHTYLAAPLGRASWFVPFHTLLVDHRIYRPHLDAIRAWFPPVPRANTEDLCLHIRLGDFANLEGRVVPVEAYLEVLRTLSFRKLHIVTDDPTNQAYLARFRDYEPAIVSTERRRSFHDPNRATTLRDFNFMRSFDKLVIGNSTYGWWAAVLGQASQVYCYRRWYRDTVRPDMPGGVDPVNLGETDYPGWVGY
jgi:SAM-dependent methyltransferase